MYVFVNAKLKWNVGFVYKNYLYSNLGIRLFDHWYIQYLGLFGLVSRSSGCYLRCSDCYHYYLDESCSLVFDNHVILLIGVLIY